MVDEVGIDEDLVWGAEGLVVLEEEVGRNLGHFADDIFGFGLLLDLRELLDLVLS